MDRADKRQQDQQFRQGNVIAKAALRDREQQNDSPASLAAIHLPVNNQRASDPDRLCQWVGGDGGEKLLEKAARTHM